MKEPIISEAAGKPPEVDTSWIRPEQARVFRSCLAGLVDARIPFVVGGAFALYVYTGIARNTKDLDIFLPPEHVRSALDAVNKKGFHIEVRDSLWLARSRPTTYRNSCRAAAAAGTISASISPREKPARYLNRDSSVVR